MITISSPPDLQKCKSKKPNKKQKIKQEAQRKVISDIRFMEKILKTIQF